MAHPTKHHNHHKSDAELEEDILAELSADSRVEPGDVGVDVRGGIVTMIGSVSSWAKRLAAEDAVRRVSGVLDVDNEISVAAAGAHRTDADVAAAVRHALRWDALVPDDVIHSTVDNGTVTLEGEVDTYAQRDDAAHAVRNLIGVRLVENHITVRHAEVTPSELRAAILDALARHAQQDAEQLEIDVEGGRITLHGQVHSWREREAVIGAVASIRGVENVVDRMRIG